MDLFSDKVMGSQPLKEKSKGDLKYKLERSYRDVEIRNIQLKQIEEQKVEKLFNESLKV